MIVKPVYINGKNLEINNIDFSNILFLVKNSTINYLNDNVNADIEGITFLKWCKDKLIINSNNLIYQSLMQNAIYWINMGYGIGSEIRKIRPAIIWRTTADNKMCTIIPLTTKNKGDNELSPKV